MIDCHLHLQDEKLYSDADEIMQRLREIGVKRLVVNGTEPEDWERVADLADRFGEVIPFFGVHPWKVNGLESEWREQLREYLERFPEAGVGEVGLDQWIRDHDIDKQREILESQLKIANELNRSVAVHCLQAWGHLLECIQEGRADDSTLFDCILLHSFGGPVEMVDRFIDLGVYFSISGHFFRKDKSEKLTVFEQIPDDRLLIETDAPDMLPPPDLCVDDSDPEVNHPASIAHIYEAVAAWKSESISDLRRRTEDNFHAWYHADNACETASAKSESE